jgi:hypothetical protein
MVAALTHVVSCARQATLTDSLIVLGQQCIMQIFLSRCNARARFLVIIKYVRVPWFVSSIFKYP